MATLEKIRSKSVFLIVVIGVALLAFIIGDALTNSRNILGDNTTVAKAGGAKIDISEYQRKREELNNQLEEARRQNPQQFANFDTQTLSQMAIDQLLVEKMLLNAADKAGIQSTGNLLRYYMLENPQNPEVMNVIRMLNAAGIPATNAQQAYELIFNPQRNGLTVAQVEPFQRAWLNAEKATEKLIKESIYQRLLAGTVRANDLDKKSMYEDYIATLNVDMAFMPYGQLDAKKYPVSDQEIQDRYNKEKGQFLVEEPTREISFIAVPVQPSGEDQKVSKELAAATLADLSRNTQISKQLKKDGVSVTRHTVRTSDVPANMKEILASMPLDSARIESNDIQGFTIVKLLSRTTKVDSVELSVVYAATPALGKKVLTALNSNTPVDSLNARFGMDSVQAPPNQWIPLFTAAGETNALTKGQLYSLRNNTGRYIVLQEGAQGVAMAKMVSEKPAVSIVEYDEATYTLSPSNKTKNDARTKLEKFLGANNTAKKFNANAQKAGYSVQKLTITASTPAIPRFQGMNQYFPDSRQVVRWVMMDGEAGEVSHIYNANDPVHPMMYAVAIDDAYDEYAPVTNQAVREYLTQLIRAEKAGDALVKQYSKNAQSVQSAAQAMKVEVKNIPNFRFGPGTGVGDTRIVGRIAGSKPGEKVVITKGTDGVYVYKILGANKENFPFNDQQYQQQYMQLINPDMAKMLRGNSKLKNNVYKFEAGE